MQFFFIVGVIGIIISGIFIGAWTDGQRDRRNYNSETTEHRNFRIKTAIYFGLIGLISMGIACLLYFF